jgi:hypothetical protein
MRWLVLIAILAFVFSQLTRLRPSKRDQQLQALRKAAANAGLLVRFWTARNSGYTNRQLPDSGFIYQLPWMAHRHAPVNWAIWIAVDGSLSNLAGNPPELAERWLFSFRDRFADAWALLECNDSGLNLLWHERGEPDDVQNIADALDLLRKNLDALPG